jgi:hypothetical protein
LEMSNRAGACRQRRDEARYGARRFSVSALFPSTGQRWRLVNEACIVDLFDKEVCDVRARDEAGSPVAVYLFNAGLALLVEHHVHALKHEIVRL